MLNNVGPAILMPSALPPTNVTTSSIRERCTIHALSDAVDGGEDTGELICSKVTICH